MKAEVNNVRRYSSSGDENERVFVDIIPMDVSEETLEVLKTKIRLLGDELGIVVGMNEIVSKTTDRGTNHYVIG